MTDRSRRQHESRRERQSRQRSERETARERRRGRQNFSPQQRQEGSGRPEPIQQPPTQQTPSGQPPIQQPQTQNSAQQPQTKQSQFGQQPTNYAGASGVGVPQGGAPQPQFGAAMGSPGQLTSQPTELYPEAFADHLTEEGRECLDDCIDVSQVAAWCADRCLEQGSQYAQCSRLCNEAATLGAVSAEFLAKDAVGLPAVIEAYLEIAERAVEELSKFDTVHTNEAEMVIDRSIESSLDALERL